MTSQSFIIQAFLIHYRSLIKSSPSLSLYNLCRHQSERAQSPSASQTVSAKRATVRHLSPPYLWHLAALICLKLSSPTRQRLLSPSVNLSKDVWNYLASKWRLEHRCHQAMGRKEIPTAAVKAEVINGWCAHLKRRMKQLRNEPKSRLILIHFTFISLPWFWFVWSVVVQRWSAFCWVTCYILPQV